MANLDLLILLSYLALLIYLGMKRHKGDVAHDYLLMGRRLTLPAFVMTLVSTWYGGILGVSEYSYRYGISNWVVFGIPYYVFAIVFALLLAKRARQSQVESIPHLLTSHYSPRVGNMSAWLVLILATPAPYVLTIGALLHFFLGWPLPTAIAVGALFSLLYVYRDGLAVIVRTDLLQCVLMYGGTFILFAAAIYNYGSPLSLLERAAVASPDHVTWNGGATVSYIMVWFFIASWTLVSPGFHQRVYAAQDAVTARRGILWSVGFWCLFDLMTTSIGLYAFMALPDLADPKMAFLTLARELLPVGLYGLFLTGILAVVMSTLDSQLFVSGVTLGKDILGTTEWGKKYQNPQLTRLGMALVAMAAVILSIYLPSVVSMYYTIGTLAVPALLLPVLGALGLLPKIPAFWAGACLVCAPTSAAGWWLLTTHTENAIPPFYAGLTGAVACWCIGILVRRFHQTPLSRLSS